MERSSDQHASCTNNTTIAVLGHTSIPEIDGLPDMETGLQKAQELPMFLLFLVLAFSSSSLRPKGTFLRKSYWEGWDIWQSLY